MDRLTRPFTVADGDPWLQPTIGKQFVDTEAHREYLSEFAHYLQNASKLRRGCAVPRRDYRADLVAHISSKGNRLAQPVVVMAGGGYGAGKTTIVDFLVRAKKVPIELGAVTGVDYFKAYLPEFSLLQMLSDGNASTIVQEESRSLAEETFMRMVENKMSFGWDSSMTNLSETIHRITEAKKNGCKLVLVAVFAPVNVAIRQAMERARKSRRFAHPDFLPKSHVDFQGNFKTYVPYFDEVFVFVNDGILDSYGKKNPRLIAEKVASQAELAIYDSERFAMFVV